MNNNPYGTKSWYLNGQLHRIDGPAIEYADGRKQWCLNGKLYRLDGPAYLCYDRDEEWYINNYNISSINDFICWLQNE